MISSLLSFSLVLAGALASPIVTPYALHERRDVLPRGWTKGDRVAREAVLPMRIGLTQRNLHNGYDMLMDV